MVALQLLYLASRTWHGVITRQVILWELKVSSLQRRPLGHNSLFTSYSHKLVSLRRSICLLFSYFVVFHISFSLLACTWYYNIRSWLSKTKHMKILKLTKTFTMYAVVCCSVTKSAFTLGLLLAYNHTHPIIDHTYLVLAGGCVLVAMRRFHLKTTDAFAVPQHWMWSSLTCLSAAHPMEDADPVTVETNVMDKGRMKTDGESEKIKEHLKADWFNQITCANCPSILASMTIVFHRLLYIIHFYPL